MMDEDDDSEDDVSVQEEEEDTPDLYRNSALGMCVFVSPFASSKDF